MSFICKEIQYPFEKRVILLQSKDVIEGIGLLTWILFHLNYDKENVYLTYKCNFFFIVLLNHLSDLSKYTCAYVSADDLNRDFFTFTVRRILDSSLCC